ncbi:MAG: hypothetical protein ABR596_04310 [Halarsenatibacteraceae bacterium]
MPVKTLLNRLSEEQAATMNLILDIEELTPTDNTYIGWERKIVCPNCHKRTLLMKSHSKTGAYYKCLECSRAGDLYVLYNDLMGKTLLESGEAV